MHLHNIYPFLNHLCDGELTGGVAGATTKFLNHLCDGEQLATRAEQRAIFLNHLCDGERKSWCQQ
ncbi:hypothetical protein ENHYDAX1_220300 [Enhydrobacter sp. AX1]|nr:hypothetical protein ENHYDAX1_220300 [Enhydrobacter sp. AX1]